MHQFVNKLPASLCNGFIFAKDQYNLQKWHFQVVKVTKSIANKVKSFFGLDKKDEDATKSTVVVEANEATSAAPEKVVEAAAASTAASKKE